MDTKPVPPPVPTAAPGPRAPGARSREPLLTFPVVLLLLCGALGWTAEGILQPAIPLLVLDRGGDAVLVGIVAAAFAIPTLILRPVIGHRIDRIGHGPVHRLGAGIMALVPVAYGILPLLLMPVARLLSGVGWAMYGTANNVVLARLAPVSRRAEASAYFNVAYALGFLVGPLVGLFLYTSVTAEAPLVAASVTLAIAFAAITVLSRATRGHGSEGPAAGGHVPAAPAPAAPVAAAPAPAGTIPTSVDERPAPGLGLRLLAVAFEPAALPAMLGTAMFMASQALFLAFAPVYARETGFAVERLALYYPAYAILLAVGQLLTGRVSDRLGRMRAIRLGIGLAVTGLAIAILPGELLTFALGGGLVAIGTAFASPSFAASAMDLAPAGRLGVTMATFSMAFQLASGIGGALWGLIIGTVGYPWPFVVALVLQLLSLGLAGRYLAPRPRPEPSPIV